MVKGAQDTSRQGMVRVSPGCSSFNWIGASTQKSCNTLITIFDNHSVQTHLILQFFLIGSTSLSNSLMKCCLTIVRVLTRNIHTNWWCFRKRETVYVSLTQDFYWVSHTWVMQWKDKNMEWKYLFIIEPREILIPFDDIVDMTTTVGPIYKCWRSKSGVRVHTHHMHVLDLTIWPRQNKSQHNLHPCVDCIINIYETFIYCLSTAGGFWRLSVFLGNKLYLQWVFTMIL